MADSTALWIAGDAAQPRTMYDAAHVVAAIESVLDEQPGVVTPDLGGTGTTEGLGRAIAARIAAATDDLTLVTEGDRA